MPQPAPTPTPTRQTLQRAASLLVPLLVPLLLPLAVAAQPAADAGARVRPPAEQGCPPDRLTLYAGTVLKYRRGPGRTEIRIRTDWATTETVTLKHPGSDDPSRWFLIERQPFAAVDWARIEKRPGQLKSGLRVAAWVCDDGRNATVDWAPQAP